MADLELGRIDEHRLAEYIAGQRWYGSKSRDIAHASVVEEVPLQEASPRCSLVLVEVRFHPGTHDTYQLLLGARPARDGWSGETIAEVDGWSVYDALAD